MFKKSRLGVRSCSDIVTGSASLQYSSKASMHQLQDHHPLLIKSSSSLGLKFSVAPLVLDSPVRSISSRALLVLYLHSFIIGVLKGVLKSQH